jgi:hypothetical protein
MMKTFSEYCKEQDIKDLSQWLESQGYDPKTLDLEAILEEGWKDTLKGWGKKAVIAGALAGGAYGMFGKGGADAPDAPSKQPQTQSKESDPNKFVFDDDDASARTMSRANAERFQRTRWRNQQKRNQLEKAGRLHTTTSGSSTTTSGSGTFKHGKLQDDKQSQDDGSKTIISSRASRYK